MYPRKAAPKSEFEVSDKIEAKRKEKLLSMKKREELKDVLMAKFNDKHSSTNSAAEKAIKEEVANFITNADMSDANLSRLERRIQSRVDNRTAHLEDDHISEYSGSKCAPSVSTQQQLGNPNRYEWSKLDTYAQYIAEQDAARMKEEERCMKQKIADDLKRQIRDSKLRANLEKDEDMKYSKAINIETEIWAEYEKKVAAEKRYKAEREKQDRIEQTQQQLIRKNLEAQRNAQEDKAMLDRIAREIAEEKHKILSRREAQVRAAKRILHENEIDKALKEDAIRKQHDEEVRIVREYNEEVERAMARREAEARDRTERQKTLLEKMQWKVDQQQSKRADEDNNRAIKQAAEREERAAELDRLKRERLAELQSTTVAVLDRQVREKEEAKKQKEAVKSLFTKIIEDDTKDFQQEEHARALAKQQRFREYKLALEKQIQDKRQQSAAVPRPNEMTDYEMKINRKLLEVVDRTLNERQSPQLSPEPTRAQISQST